MAELQFDPMQEVPPTRLVAKRRPTGWMAMGVLAILVALGLWLFLRSSRPGGPPAVAPATAGAAPAPLVPAPLPEGPSPDPGLPELGQSDDFVRSLIAGLFGSPELDQWLASAEELVQQGVRAILAVSEQRSPRRFLTFLPVEGRFAASARGDGWIIAPESYRRYDRVIDLFVGLDTQQIARLVARVAPLLSRAMDENALPGTGFEAALESAIEHLSATPSPSGDLEVILGEDGIYRFADPALEALSAPQKQLLRLGARNGARVREKLRELSRAFDEG
jgi:hypothetical protein